MLGANHSFAAVFLVKGQVLTPPQNPGPWVSRGLVPHPEASSPPCRAIPRADSEN